MPTGRVAGMARKILCVAEKPSIAKSVAQHLGSGRVSTVSWPTVLLLPCSVTRRDTSLVTNTSRITSSISTLALHGVNAMLS